MTGPEGQGPDEDFHVRVWLKWLERQPVGCVLCKRILFDSQLHGGQIKTLDIRGVEMTREQQISHLSTCVPDRQQRARG